MSEEENKLSRAAQAQMLSEKLRHWMQNMGPEGKDILLMLNNSLLPAGHRAIDAIEAGVEPVYLFVINNWIPAKPDMTVKQALAVRRVADEFLDWILREPADANNRLAVIAQVNNRIKVDRMINGLIAGMASEYYLAINDYNAAKKEPAVDITNIDEAKIPEVVDQLTELLFLTPTQVSALTEYLHFGTVESIKVPPMKDAEPTSLDRLMRRTTDVTRTFDQLLERAGKVFTEKLDKIHEQAVEAGHDGGLIKTMMHFIITEEERKKREENSAKAVSVIETMIEAIRKKDRAAKS